MRAHVPPAILKFLDSFHQEIHGAETVHGLQIGPQDARPPIDYYHDVIRALQTSKGKTHERLTVERVAADLQRIRTHAEWLESGPYIFLKPSHAPQAPTFKRHILSRAGELNVAPEAMLLDLSDFLRRYRNQELQDALAKRGAETLSSRGGTPYYKPYPANEFWKDAQATIRRYQETAQGELTHAPAGLLEAEKSRSFLGLGKAVPLLSRGDRKHARQQLTTLWLQTLHPLNLWQAFTRHDAETDPAKHFHPERVVSESQWQEWTGEAFRLARLYEQYIVLFAAALQDEVNQSFKELMEDMNQFVTDAAELVELIKEIMEQANEAELAEIKDVIEQTPNEELKESILLLLHQQMMERNRRDAKKEAARAAIKEIEGLMKQKDAQIQSLDKAHFDFLASQLMVYHNSQDLIKKMSGQGLNIAGKFMETETARGTGRGQGPRRGR